ncbi:hypothetical protein OROGR_031836 [Orobanche gracilis]
MDSKRSGFTFDDSCIRRKEDEYRGSKWLYMERRIEVLVRKLYVSNIQFVAHEIMKLHNLIIPGRGLFCQAVMKAQSGSPRSSNLYASLVAIINSRFPDVGLLLVKRVVLGVNVPQFKDAYDRNDTKRMRYASTFLAHLVNQTVVYEVLAIDVLLLLLGDPSPDNIEVAVSFCMECGSSLLDYTPHKLREIFKEFVGLLRKEGMEKRIRVGVVKLLAVRKSRFKRYPSMIDELDLVEVGDQVTHEVSLLHDIDPETSLDDFKPDSEFDHDQCEMFSRMMIN